LLLTRFDGHGNTAHRPASGRGRARKGVSADGQHRPAKVADASSQWQTRRPSRVAPVWISPEERDNRAVQVEAEVAAVTDLPEAEKAARFDELQRKLVPLWQSIEKMSQDEQTIVVVPSMTGGKIGLHGAMLQAYEERFLFLLFLLRQPRAR